MNINRINCNFKGIYTVPYSENNLKEIKEQVFPIYAQVTNQKSFYFVGQNPCYPVLKNNIKNIAKNNNSSVEWLQMNAENHGADTRCFDENCIYIISGDSDIKAFENYSKKRKEIRQKEEKEIIKKHFSLFSKIKKLFGAQEEFDLGFDKNTPEHLKELFFLIKAYKRETELFEENMPKALEVKTPKELLLQMMRER